MVALVTSGVQGYDTIGTSSCTIIGLIGAAYCSVRGVGAVINLEWVDRGRHR